MLYNPPKPAHRSHVVNTGLCERLPDQLHYPPSTKGVRYCAATVFLSRSTAESHPDMQPGTVLMGVMQRRKHDGSLGAVSLPKGQVEGEESIEGATAEELYEEIGATAATVDSKIQVTGVTYRRMRHGKVNIISICMAHGQPSEPSPVAEDAGYAALYPVEEAVQMLSHPEAQVATVQALGAAGIRVLTPVFCSPVA